MESSTPFFVTLPSSVITTKDWKGRKENLLSNWRTQLPVSLQLDGTWEVALAEIVYPNNFINVSNDYECWFQVEWKDEPAKHLSKKLFIKIFLPARKYALVSDVIFTLNELYDQELQKKCSDAKISWASARENAFVSFVFSEYGAERGVKVKFNYSSGVKSLKMSPKLAYLLGFKSTTLTPSQVVKAEYDPDMKSGLFVIYCYIDIIENVIVGDKLAPLIRAIPIDNQNETLTIRSFNPYMYCPISKHNIDSIEVSLRDDAGNLIPFQHGRTCVTLHFRRRRYEFYQ